MLFRNSSSTQEEHKETEELVQTNQSEEEEELGQTVEETITSKQLDEETETVGETRRKTLSETSHEVSEESGEEEEEVTMAELELLKKLEEANRLIECDTKSLSCLSVGAVPKSHSRSPSIASQESHGNSQEPGDDLWVMWSDILKSWDRRKGANVKDLVRQGIPHHFRGMAWQVLCEAHQSQDKAKYSGLLRTQSACEKVIRLVLFVVVL